MTQEIDASNKRLAIVSGENSFCPQTFFACYIKDGDAYSLTRIGDVNYNEALTLLTMITDILNDFVKGFAENFTDTDEDEDKVKFDKDEP